MPHVITQVEPGTSEQQKQNLAAAFTKAVTKAFGATDPAFTAANVSVAVEEVSSKTPNVVVKLWPGRPDSQIHQIADDFTKAMTKTLGGDEKFSVTFKEIAPEDWISKVYDPEIIGKPGTLYKKPGYDPKTL